MCYPDADEPLRLFFDALERFEKDLHDILIFSMPAKRKYIKIYSEVGPRKFKIYLQRRTNQIVKILVNTDMSEREHNKDPVDISADDVILSAQLNGLDSVRIMREQAAIIREIIYEDQIIVALTYNIK